MLTTEGGRIMRLETLLYSSGERLKPFDQLQRDQRLAASLHKKHPQEYRYWLVAINLSDSIHEGLQSCQRKNKRLVSKLVKYHLNERFEDEFKRGIHYVVSYSYVFIIFVFAYVLVYAFVFVYVFDFV